LGYYKDEQKTAATFVTVDGVRWALPGDYALVEADGTITLLGRGSACINSGGEKIYPEEVEAAVRSHPGVFDAVVVGVPDEKWGERVTAVVQPRPGVALTLEELDKHCREHVSGYKVPRGLTLVEEMVRQPSGKPDYRWAKGGRRGTTSAQLNRTSLLPRDRSCNSAEARASPDLVSRASHRPERTTQSDDVSVAKGDSRSPGREKVISCHLIPLDFPASARSCQRAVVRSLCHGYGNAFVAEDTGPCSRHFKSPGA
jgi:hypothetical protein